MGMAWSIRHDSCNISRTMGVRGLSNCGLSCCINALLQAFAATAEIQELLSRWQPSDNPTISNVPLQLKRALEAMKDKKKADPHLDFLQCLHHNHFSRLLQHDADEVFHGILNHVRKQMSDQQIVAEIEKLYKIEVEGCCRCLNCENVHRVPSYFFSFPLHLCGNKNTLEDCFRMFFDSQKLEGSEAFYCTKCEQKTPCIQGDRLVSLPSILCITLKRFRNMNSLTRKLNTRVSFPETINMAAVFPEEQPQVGGLYRLYGVIAHSGMDRCGHYTAYICSQDHQWFYINDGNVSQVSWKEVQETYGGNRVFSETAYLLMYRKQSSEEAPRQC
ncbi:ubl carboxyl-terminal hydrolase 18 [Silurus meridionalis]|uniref:ubl carboxyl-terminal hydrolase 18 n=1 Tax=Silurus meridionalis TaxID=175797 RepID=UPI001EEB29FE|nr:ubl carboxyl-terminal hydrolase 18 [Silurus meridionalis]